MPPPFDGLATDAGINEFVEQYVMARNLSRLTEDPTPTQRMCERLGLYNDPQLYAQLESVFAEWISKKLAEMKSTK